MLERSSNMVLYSMTLILRAQTILRAKGLENFLKSFTSSTINGVQIKTEMKKLWPFENNCAKLEGHFEMISKFNL